MRIKKTSQYIEGGANLSNVYGTSDENGYTQEYINGIIESGIDAETGQEWTKFADGTLIIRHQVEVSNKAVNQAFGSWYMSDAILPSDYIISFVSAPNVIFTYGSTTQTAIAGASGVSSTTSTGSFRLFRGSSIASVNGIVYITSIGRWK